MRSFSFGSCARRNKMKWKGCANIYWPHSCTHRQSYKVISWHVSCDSQAPAQCSNFLDALFPMCDVPLQHHYLFSWQLQCQWQGKRITVCCFTKISWKLKSQSPCWVLNSHLSVLLQEDFLHLTTSRMTLYIQITCFRSSSVLQH